MSIRSIVLTLTLALASTVASAVTVVSGNVAPGQWGIVEFTHSGGNIQIGSPASSNGSTVDDPYLTLFVNNGSPFTAFTGTFVGSDDDGAVG